MPFAFIAATATGVFPARDDFGKPPLAAAPGVSRAEAEYDGVIDRSATWSHGPSKICRLLQRPAGARCRYRQASDRQAQEVAAADTAAPSRDLCWPAAQA